MEEILEVLLDALIDSVKVFVLALLIYIIFSFVEKYITTLLKKHKKASPFFGSLCGLIPQCGTSVIASDMYLKNHISLGCVVAVFFACSDEALPILLTDFDHAMSVIPLLLIKLILGFILGFIVDLLIKKKDNDIIELSQEYDDCHHKINYANTKLYKHLVHPILHALQIFIYVLVVNIIFGLIIYAIGGEEVLSSFLAQNSYLAPFVSTVVGIIPNCASSVLITEMYLINGIPFGALVSGLCMNAGLGFVYLLKNRKHIKDVLIIFIILFIASLATGYIVMGVMSLFGI